MERRSGLYILGTQGSGKTTLLKNLIYQDMRNDHGVFFLDPHGGAIDDLLTRIPAKREKDVIVLDPLHETHSFGMNLLACPDPDNPTERSRTFAQAIDIFKKLYADPQKGELDILLNQYLRNSFFPLIANQGYTILEIPLLLEEKPFRDLLLGHPSITPEEKRFWHTTFDRMRADKQREEIASTLRRLNEFSDFHIRHIVGQSTTAPLNFTDIMNTGTILFVKLSKTLPGDAWRIIGTMLISNLVNAVLQRERIPEAERRHFCVFVDEFQYFADSKDFDVLYTQGRKYAVTTTIAHQERSGQLAGNQRLAGAIDTAGHKVFLQQTRPDAERHASEVAKASPTHIRQERQLGISQQPFADLLRGHTNSDIRRFVNEYLRPLQHRLEDAKEDFEAERLLRDAIRDEVALLGVDEQYEREANALARGRPLALSHEALSQKEQALVRSQQQTLRLIRLHESARDLRLAQRSLNAFLTAIMEGAVLPVPGQELFSHFLLAFVRLSAPVPDAASQAFALYVSLRYGSPELARSIPITLAARYQAVPHEELYRHVEAQYIRQVQTVAEEMRQEDQEDWDTKRQDEYERVLRKILTWKCEPRLLENLERASKYMQALKHEPVRKFLTPYLLSARFAPPWYCGDPNEPPAPLRIPSGATQEVQSLLSFLHQYWPGSFVVLALLQAAFTGQGMDSTNRSEPSPYPPTAPWHPNPHFVLNIRDFYPHLHMLELPAIAGMEPFQVWQAITELHALLLTCGSGPLHNYIGNKGVSLVPPVLRLEDRSDALLLMEQVETDFPNAHGLRSLWSALTEEDIQFVGRNRYRLAGVVGKRYNHVPWLAKDQVYYRIAEYKKKQPRQLGQMLTLPYALERTWYRCDEMIRTYLIARACDLVTYGDVVADRTFPQPTLPGIPAQEVSATVAVLVEILLAAQAQKNASEEREWAGRVDELVRQCLWKRDGLLHLQVYQAEGRVHLRQPAWRYLPPRVLPHQERTTLEAACFKELASADRALSALDAFVQFCQLLRLPENHVRTQTAQYVEREVSTYPTREMGDQMARELMDLPLGFAYVKSTWTGKIQTLPFTPSAQVALVDMRRGARQNAIGDGILRPRSAIEAEIRKRQQEWRRRPGNEPSPPTSTGGNSPPSLPSASAGSDPEATPTHEISKKPSEKKPPQTRNWSLDMGSQLKDQPPLSSEKAPAQKPPGSSKGRKEGVVQKRRTKQKTGQEEPKREAKRERRAAIPGEGVCY
jgi:hypothetical protein